MDAPTISFEQVSEVVENEFGKSLNEIFQEFDEKPIASASIAQVHKAKLFDGNLVAVKIQKPDIAHQMDLDLLTFKYLLHTLEFLFGLPMIWTLETTEKHIREEVNFTNEALNSERASSEILKESRLRNSVYIPLVYWGSTTSRVLTTEWIDGISLLKRNSLEMENYSIREISKICVALFSYQVLD